MKNLLHVRLVGFLIAFSLLSFSAREAHYYVVIGAFAKESNAKKFTGFARNLYLDAFYRFNPERNLYYVHAMETGRKDEARNWTLYLKHEKGFRDAWVFTSLAVDSNESAVAARQGVQESEPRYSGNQDVQLSNYSYIASASGSGNILKYQYAGKSGDVAAEASWTEVDGISYASSISDVAGARKRMSASGDKLFTFVAETADGKTIPAEIMLVDYKKAKKLTSFRTGEYVGLRGKKQNKSVTLVCDIFGYSVETKAFSFDNLSRARDVKQNNEGVWEVKFRLKPMKENEISILYNTAFYADAAVLQPSSKKQVDQVLSLMKANPSYKILLHSHCNKGSRRDIKLPGKKKNYFDLAEAVEKTGSDKQLTRERGETIKAYLVENGIDSKRIGVFGWGSLDNLVSAASANTTINDRIEVELVQK